EGFLRSETSLIQVAGRAARNINGMVIMYADNITGSIKRTVQETSRRRKLQEEFNRKHGITPQGIKKAIRQGIEDLEEAEDFVAGLTGQNNEDYQIARYISDLEYKMELAARNLQFEEAAKLRDQIKQFKKSLNRR
ncbi:MAG: UvrB/UvrC motif-containing protein, partial [Candidatus Omnitrophica bacterium]|nr:UvrB/UvrC motif-containing protein [Candidatus Omnitrophota bacterium]